MNCDLAAEHISELLNDSLAEDARDELRRHLAVCEACREEAAGLTELWERLGDLEDSVPGTRMRARFYSALAAYEHDQAPTFTERVQRVAVRFWPRQVAWQMGIAAAALVVGILIGPQLMIHPPTRTDPSLERLSHEVQAMNRVVSLSLLEHQSASERLRGIEWSLRSAQDATVVDALLKAVKFDTNVNVRLAAVEALSGMIERPEVYDGLAEALPRQESPVMQVALADVLLAVDRDESKSAVRQVLQRGDLDPRVRKQLEDSLAGPI